MARTPAKKAEPGPASAYTVISQVEHDHEVYAPGDTIELSDADARPLLEVKAIAAGKAKAEPTE